MKTVAIRKAQGIGEREIESVTIVIEQAMELASLTAQARSSDLREVELARFYQLEAERLGEAIWDTLPGGTLDRLIAYLLTRKASLLAVPLSRKSA